VVAVWDNFIGPLQISNRYNISTFLKIQKNMMYGLEEN
jgi:hypothetical protein